jgi:hypothetical protein
MSVRIGGASDPGPLDKLDGPTWLPRGLREMDERLRQRELHEKYKSSAWDSAHPTKTPTAAQLAEISEHMRKGENQKAIEKTIAYWGIDTKNVNGQVTYNGGLAYRGFTDKTRNVSIGPEVFTEAGAHPGGLAATVLHEVTHANQIKQHGYPSERAGWTNARINQEFDAYEAMGYEAALRHADQLGLRADEKQWYEGKHDKYRDRLTPGNREQYDAGQYWDMK